MTNTDNLQSVEAEQAAVQSSARLRKIFAWAGVAIAVVTVGVLAYIFAYRNPAIQNGDKAIGSVDAMAVSGASDSILVEAYKEVADNHGFSAGNRADYMAAVLLYQQGDYQQALDRINKFSASDKVIASLAEALKGDCLVNLDLNADALKAFDSAMSKCDNNPQLMPYYMTKKAVILSYEGKHAESAKLYKEIEKQYPHYAYSTTTHSRMLQEEGMAEILETKK